MLSAPSAVIPYGDIWGALEIKHVTPTSPQRSCGLARAESNRILAGQMASESTFTVAPSIWLIIWTVYVFGARDLADRNDPVAHPTGNTHGSFSSRLNPTRGHSAAV